MPSNRWDTELLAAKCVLLGYTVEPNDIQNQGITRAWRGLNIGQANAIKTVLDAQTTVTDPVIDGITFTGTWRVGQAQIERIESGPLAGSHQVTQSIKEGNNTACMSVLNERLVRSRAYPLEQNENAWMYYELMQKEETKKWTGLSYAAAVTEYEYLWQIFRASEESKPTREHQIIYADTTGIIAGPLHYPGYDSGSTYATLVVGKYYIIGAELNFDETRVMPTITEITNPVIETWYEEERDGSYTMYRTLKSTTATPIMRNRVLQYAGMARVKGTPIVDDDEITIYGLNRATETIYQHAKFRIGSDVYRVTEDATAEDGEVTVSVTPLVTAATEDLCDAGVENETQVYFEAL